MARYLPLFTIVVQHDFFADGVCRALEFTPDAKTAAWLDRADLLAKPNTDGIGVYCTAERAEVLRRCLSAEDENVLRFEGFAKAPDFCQYTFPAIKTPATMWRLDSGDATVDETGLRLHKAPYVSEECVSEATTGGLRKPPLVVVDVHLSAEDFAAGEDGLPKPRRFYMRFEPRRTYWKYYLLGDLARRNAYISDLNGELEFERAEAPELGDRSALVYVSRVALPMREMPSQRLQLRGRDGVVEKVLIKRLPNADSGRLGKGKVEGREVLVSEIFVNQ